jgi:two-component system phosphate regulon sensor histidine kinase PhoR
MNYSNPRILALYNALLVVIFVTIIYVFLSFTFFDFSLIPLIILDVTLFVFTFLLLRYTLDKFIYEKIRLIYKTIHNLKSSTKKEDKKRIDQNIIENVNRQVLEWGQVQQDEINKLKELAKYRREFLGNVSHELKTPIFNIQGYVLTLLDGGLEDQKINREYLLKTEKSINRMIAIIEDLEEISRLESGELKLHLVSFDIVQLTKEVVEFLEIKAKKKNIKIGFLKNYDKPINVFGDKKRLRQVLINLLDNTIKYGIPEDGNTKISFFDMDENILVEVTDNGIGIDEENLPRLFERFYRTDKGRSREQGGSGLGLAIVKHIIEAHNQVINVRSKVGVGTTFAFTLKKSKN